MGKEGLVEIYDSVADILPPDGAAGAEDIGAIFIAPLLHTTINPEEEGIIRDHKEG